jgi:C1A family cysteine protease
MFKTFSAVALIGAASAVDQQTFEFMQYVSKFGKNYQSLDEFTMRQALFAATDAIIAEHNADDSATSAMGHNFISDLTHAEKRNLAGLAGAPEMNFEETYEHDGSPLPNSVNWVTAGKVGAVKDQGQCGSCWAFSATGSLESAIAISEGGSPLNFSEQQLVSCSSSYGNNGCGGGWYYWAWDYLKTHAQEYTSAYPYTSGSRGIDGNCKYVSSSGHAKVSSYAKVGTSNSSIMSAINQKPVSVALDAQRSVFQQYTSGVVTSGCGTMLDHAVMAVGYGYDSASGLDYFLVRNSWGSSWGDNGYIKIGQSGTGGSPGYCGINKNVYTVSAYTM